MDNVVTNSGVQRLTPRNRWCYCLGGLRDAAYNLISMFLINYVQYTMGLSTAQFAVLTAIVVICRVWDAVNDPMMATIIENARLKGGKYRPWLLYGVLSNAVIIVLLFSLRPAGWGFVALFGLLYLLWGMTFTMNDVSFWSMLPSLTSDAKERDSLTSMLSIFTSIGAFSVAGLVPIFVGGNAVVAYRTIAIIVALFFIGTQLITFFGVKEAPIQPKKENVSLGAMFKTIKRNDQLLWSVLVILLYYIGSGLLIAFGLNFFYFEYGYAAGGGMMTMFTVAYAVGTLAAQFVYAPLAKKFSRNKLLLGSLILIALGYAMFMAFGYILPKNDIVLMALGIILFFGQAIFYMVILVQMNNTIEYNEYKYGERSESIVASLRSFMAKLSSALQQGVVTIVLMISGIYALTQQIAGVEQQVVDGLTKDEAIAAAEPIIASATPTMLLVLRIGMVVVPLACMIIAYFVAKKKNKIDEKTYDEILVALAERKAAEKETAE